MEALPLLPDGSHLDPRSWSLYYTRLLGFSTRGAVVVLSLRDRTYRQLASRGEGTARWLPDRRRVIYSSSGEFFVVDETTGASENIGRADPDQLGADARPTLAWSLSRGRALDLSVAVPCRIRSLADDCPGRAAGSRPMKTAVLRRPAIQPR